MSSTEAVTCTVCQQPIENEYYQIVADGIEGEYRPEFPPAEAEVSHPIGSACEPTGSRKFRWQRIRLTCVCGTILDWDTDEWQERHYTVYCSPECRAEARRQRRRHPRTERSMTCAACEQPFTATRSDARYCSTRCRVRAHRAT